VFAPAFEFGLAAAFGSAFWSVISLCGAAAGAALSAEVELEAPVVLVADESGGVVLLELEEDGLALVLPADVVELLD